MDEHIIECLGKSKVTIKNGKITNITKPQIKYCPLFDHHNGIKEITKEKIKENIQYRIDDFGMCTPQRQLKMKDFLNFGISEIISTLLDKNIIDCAIMVCEGCGTVIITESQIAQGIGGRISGIIKTSPIPEIINQLGKNNIINPKTAEINQIVGIEKAIKMGYKNIAVTITQAEDIKNISKIKNKHHDINIYTFVVHTTEVNKEDAKILFDNCDIITSCASKNVREIGLKKSLKTVGQSIPIFSNSEDGKKFLDLRLEKIGGKKSKKNKPDLPYPLI